MPEPRSSLILYQIIEADSSLKASTQAKYTRCLNVFLSFAGTDPAGWTELSTTMFYGSLLQTGTQQHADQVMVGVKHVSKWYARLYQDSSLNFVTDNALSLVTLQTIASQIQPNSPMDLRDKALIVTCIETGVKQATLLSMDSFASNLSAQAQAEITPWLTWLQMHGSTQNHQALFRSLANKNQEWSIGRTISQQGIRQIIVDRAKAAGYVDVHLDLPVEPKWLVELRSKINE